MPSDFASRSSRDNRPDHSAFEGRSLRAPFGAASKAAARARGVGGNGNPRAARSNCENTNPNPALNGNARRSPRLGSCTGSSTNAMNTTNTMNHTLGVAGAGTRGGILSDITNVRAGRASQTDDKIKAKSTKPLNFAFQPTAATTTARSLENSDHTRCVAMKTEENDTLSLQSVPEYVTDITNRLFSEETRFLPEPQYTDMQTDITTRMRMILIDWMIEVHSKYEMRLETLYLTVNLIDRYLSKVQIKRTRLQLVGVVAMFIASKFEEINPPELHQWVYICDRAYTNEDILITECKMLTSLSFQVSVPTAAHFFEFLEKANDCDGIHRSLAQYLLELGLLDSRMLQYSPSHVVAAALLLSNELLQHSPVWPESMAQQSRHSEESLSNCARELWELLEADRAGAGGELQAVHKKFSAKDKYAVATLRFETPPAI